MDSANFSIDCYYGDERTQTWGEGSLVEYLSNLGFLPNEIVEAGLAVRTNPNSIKTVVPNEEDGNSSDFSHMMDRFRNRLVVPILDKSGQSVIGFGGRHLDSAQRHDDDKSSFVPAKYINSPESSVFRKKVRFGSVFHKASLLHIVPQTNELVPHKEYIVQ